MSGQLRKLETAGVRAPTDCWYALASSGSVGRESARPASARSSPRPLPPHRRTGRRARGPVCPPGLPAERRRPDGRHRPLRAVRLRLRHRRPVRPGPHPEPCPVRGGASPPTRCTSRTGWCGSGWASPAGHACTGCRICRGSPGRAGPPWPAGPSVAAGYLLLHENFADVTQVPFVAPEIAPAVLGAEPPPLDVVVTETTVTLHRSFPPAPLPGWQAELLGVGSRRVSRRLRTLLPLARRMGRPLGRRRRRQDPRAPPPGCGSPSSSPRSTPGAAACCGGQPRLRRRRRRRRGRCRRRVRGLLRAGRTAMETAQATLDLDGPGPEVNVAADVAALRVREIVSRMLAEEGAPPPGRDHDAPGPDAPDPTCRGDHPCPS